MYRFSYLLSVLVFFSLTNLWAQSTGLQRHAIAKFCKLRKNNPNISSVRLGGRIFRFTNYKNLGPYCASLVGGTSSAQRPGRIVSQGQQPTAASATHTHGAGQVSPTASTTSAPSQAPTTSTPPPRPREPEQAPATSRGSSETAVQGGTVSNPNNPCGAPGLTSLIPQSSNRSPQFPQGSSEYLRYAANEISRGNIPPHLRKLVPVTMGQGGNSCKGSTAPITVCAMPEPIAVGGGQNYNYTPIRYNDSVRIARDFGMILPTKAMVNATYRQAEVKVAPKARPWFCNRADGGDCSGSKPYRYKEQSDFVRSQLQQRAYTPGALVAGTQKDYVLTNRLRRSGSGFAKLAIYGWHRGDNRAIQPIGTPHGADYVDYSQVPRFYSQWAKVGDQWLNLRDLLRDPGCARTLNGGRALSSSVTEVFANTSLNPPGRTSGARSGTDSSR